VILFHSMINFTGELFALTERAVIRHGIRLLAPDRPGFGLSTLQPGRTMLDWATDVEDLTEHVGMARFATFGHSGGGPFVAALVHAMPERLTRAAIVSGTAPPDAEGRFRGMWFPVRMIFFLERRLPALNRVALKQMASFYADPQRMRNRMLKGLPKSDVRYLKDVPEAVGAFSADAREAHRPGGRRRRARVADGRAGLGASASRTYRWRSRFGTGGKTCRCHPRWAPTSAARYRTACST